jgi:hypothetical protein
LSVTKYRGSGQIYVFRPSTGGTVTISLPQTLTTIARDGDILDVSSGNDNQREYIGGLDTLVLTAKMFDDTQSAGTVIQGALSIPLQTGTMDYGPQGTAAGKPKYSFPYITKTANWNGPFDKPVDLTFTIHRNGAMLTDVATGGTF